MALCLTLMQLIHDDYLIISRAQVLVVSYVNNEQNISKYQDTSYHYIMITLHYVQNISVTDKISPRV